MSVPSRFHPLLLAVLVIVQAVVAGWYANVTPYRTAGLVSHQPAQDIGAPDERQHANYIQHLLDGNGLPVFQPGGPDAYEHYEFHQPPLYYALAAGWCKLGGKSDLTQAGDGQWAREFGLLIGASTVVGVYFLALWSLEREDVALAAAAFVAALPMLAAIDGAIGNDCLLFSLCTWCLAVCSRSVRQGWTWNRIIAVGILTGAAILTKSTGVALVPVVLAAAFISQPKRATWAQLGAAAGIALVMVLPWWARNQSLYGDPLAIKAFNQAFVGSPHASLFIGQFGAYGYWVDWVGWWTARSFFGVFGYMDLFLGDTLYRLLLAGTLVLVLGWVLSLGKPDWRESARAQWLNCGFAAIVFLLFVRFNMQYFQAQARYLFPAIGPIAMGLGIGLVYLCGKARYWVMAAMFLVLLGVNVYALGRLPQDFAVREASANSATMP